MSVDDVDLALEQALEEERKTHKHDPRIDKLYHQDQVVIYVFVILLWVVLWGVFFGVVNPNLEDNGLRAFLIGLALFASIFNTVGMISNIRRLKHEAVRFYSQDLYWQDEKKRRKAEGSL
jgi:hypothetical protein